MQITGRPFPRVYEVWTDEAGINIDSDDAEDGYLYDISFSRLRNVDDVVIWGQQLATKTWVTPPLLQNFYRVALEHVTAHR